MEFKDNFSQLVLLAETPVTFYLEDANLIKIARFNIYLPKFKESMIDPYISMGLGYLNLSSKDLKKIFCGINQIENIWDILQATKQNNYEDIFSQTIINLFNTYVENFKIENNNFYSGKFLIDKDLFFRIGEILLIASGVKEFEDQSKFLLGMSQEQIDRENEIKRIKAQKQGSSNGNSSEEISKLLLPLNYELGYSFEELFNMNYYHLKFLGKFISGIVRYDIQKRQVFSKKPIKYITEK